MGERVDLSRFAQLVRERDGFLIMTHCRPDGDTVVSAAALCLILRAMGKSAYMMANPEITDRYAAYAEGLFAPEGFEAGTITAVDLAAETMFPQGFAGGEVELCVDHHGSNTIYAKYALVMPEKAACGEIVLELARELGARIDKDIADRLYVAVSTDTGCFMYRNTTAGTHRAAAELIDAGADFGGLNVKLFRKVSAARLRLEGLIYGSMKSYYDGRITVATVTLDMMRSSGAQERDCDDLASLAGRVQGSVCSATIRENENGGCRISLRSGFDVNSSDVCARFGGGGHPMAAGCAMDCPPDIARERLVAAIIEEWKK